uniref:Uncharacterized protein n=1 Tax=Oryza brachyantha TaxID=4533 RepID=J3L1B1_ORYBR
MAPFGGILRAGGRLLGSQLRPKGCRTVACACLIGQGWSDSACYIIDWEKETSFPFPGTFEKVMPIDDMEC